MKQCLFACLLLVAVTMVHAQNKTTGDDKTACCQKMGCDSTKSIDPKADTLRTFPEGQLQYVFYRHGGGMRQPRYVFELVRFKDGHYELTTIRPGTDINDTYSEKALAVYNVDDAFVERIVNTLKEEKVHLLPAKNNLIGNERVLDASTYSLSCKFDDGTIRSSGIDTLPLASILAAIVAEESQ